jgi:hypothetical protein
MGRAAGRESSPSISDTLVWARVSSTLRAVSATSRRRPAISVSAAAIMAGVEAVSSFVIAAPTPALARAPGLQLCSSS